MTLEVIVEKIVKALAPEQIILFGSQARGTATIDSDIDLFVIVPYEGNRHELSAKGRGALRESRVALDVIVYPRSELNKRLEADDSLFLDNVFYDGKVIYEA
jgi:uncharacterized protein